MEEEGVKMIESLDSGWFFSNVFSTKPQDFGFHGDSDHSQVFNTGTATKLDPSIPPMISILETHQTEPQIDETLIMKTGDLGSEVGESRDQEQRKERKLIKKRINNKGMDFGFDRNQINEFWMMMMEGYEMLLTSQNQGQMMVMLPPFSDGMAMKKHLKSWAYAVACNVR